MCRFRCGVSEKSIIDVVFLQLQNSPPWCRIARTICASLHRSRDAPEMHQFECFSTLCFHQHFFVIFAQFCGFRTFLFRFFYTLCWLSRFYLSEVMNHALDDEVVTVLERHVQIVDEAITVRFIQDLEKTGFSKCRKEILYLGPPYGPR